LPQRWACQIKAGKKIEDLDLFGPVSVVAGSGVSNAGRTRLLARLLVALLYLKHAATRVMKSSFSAFAKPPLANTLLATSILRTSDHASRHKWDDSGMAVTLKLVAKKKLARVIVDSTVQEEAIAHPTDCKLLEATRDKAVEEAKALGIELK